MSELKHQDIGAIEDFLYYIYHNIETAKNLIDRIAKNKYDLAIADIRKAQEIVLKFGDLCELSDEDQLKIGQFIG